MSTQITALSKVVTQNKASGTTYAGAVSASTSLAANCAVSKPIKQLLQNEPLVMHGPHLPGLRYFTTTRIGGVSTGVWAGFNLGAHCDDDPEKVASNRDRLQQYLPAAVPWLRQVHGTAVAEFPNDLVARNLPITDADSVQSLAAIRSAAVQTTVPLTADAAFTQAADYAIAVLTADCLPIVICDADASIVAVVHAGWRGLAQGVIEQTARRLQQRRAVTSWWAWIGPAIGPKHFEVGSEVRQAFISQAPQDSVYFRSGMADKWWADLAGLAQQRLQRSFEQPIVVHLSHCCTFSDEQHFYSYRRDGITGRMATVAWLSTD